MPDAISVYPHFAPAVSAVDADARLTQPADIQRWAAPNTLITRAVDESMPKRMCRGRVASRTQRQLGSCQYLMHPPSVISAINVGIVLECLANILAIIHTPFTNSLIWEPL